MPITTVVVDRLPTTPLINSVREKDWQSEKAGIARLVLRKKRHLALLELSGGEGEVLQKARIINSNVVSQKSTLQADPIILYTYLLYPTSSCCCAAYAASFLPPSYAVHQRRGWRTACNICTETRPEVESLWHLNFSGNLRTPSSLYYIC